MGRARNFPQQLVHWAYVCVCAVLIFLSFVFSPLANLGKDSMSAASAALSPPPEGNGYTYSRSIAINHSQVPSSDQANFPLLVSGTYSYLATVANGGRVQNSNGYDIIFTSDSGCATKLNHEVETYNATTGAVSYWVKAPTVSHTSDTTIYICYGNSSITTDQSNKTAVWDANYKGVWHLPNGISLTANDSTASGSNGTNHSATAVSGKLYGGANFDGSSQNISIPQISATNTTVEHWMYRTGSADFRIMADAGWNNTDGFCTVLNSNQHGFVKHARAAVNTTISSALNTWEHVVWTVGADNKARLYLNGVFSYTDTDTQTIISAAHGGSLGSRLDASGNPFKYFPGILDEVRISNIARSADWITTEYNNQNSPSSFYTISGESGNRSPVANAGGPYSGISGTGVQFSGNSSSDPDGTIASYSWNFGDNASGSGATPTHTYATAGTYTVTLTVTDNGGATNSTTTTVPISNRPPVANAGGTYTGITGTAVSFNGSSSSDPDGTIAGYSWNFGDSNSGTGATATHTYATAGTFTVTLTVTDNLGATNSASTTATISNRPPVANAGGTYTGVTGTAVQFSGSSSSDPDGTIASYSWSFGDSNSGTGATPTHTYATAGMYTVTLTVTDNLGATNSATTTATISNRPPVANAGGPYSSTTGTAVQLSGSSSSDPDGTIASYSWNFGDNSSGSGTTPTHTYATAGTFTVTLTVTDNLGATASATASTTVTGTLDARLDPLNRAGGGGEDPLSRNFNWSIPLVDLPGRAGLDLGLSLSYNSLATWTRNGNAISFDDDHGSPTPGFRLGFPVIQGNFYNSQAGKYSYIMITPSGSRMELRQVGNSTKYQSVDSSYVLLDASNMKLRTTDGTQLSYAWKGSDYECTEIKDRNGNFITINYDGLGRVDTVKDTLSRTITFNYDANGSLGTITQSWKVNGQTLVHPWATFAYTDIQIQTNFTNLTVYGPSNNSTIHALTQVKLADDSHFDFDYTSWGQVWRIRQYTGETSAHLLNYRSYNLPVDNSTAQTDCPRFTVRHDWAENWNRDTNGAAQEVNTQFDAPIDTALPDNSLQTVTMAKVKAPDNTYQLIYFAGSISGGAGSAPAWKRGLPLLTDTYDSNNSKQRSAKVAWTQDDENISYELNPRVIDTTISDPAGNHARTSIDYAATTLSDGTTINLAQNTYEYQADTSTVLRRRHLEYNLTSDYTDTDRRIIGLVGEQTLYGGPTGSETLMSKVEYKYDQEGSIQGTDTPVQHDNTYYSASFRIGRGNLSIVTRHDVVNTSQSTTSIFKYNTAGAMVATLDPLSHGVAISYTDQFSANGTDLDTALDVTTLAYPTKVTDAAGFSSGTRYNYAFGGVTWKRTPLPNVTNVTDSEAGPVQIIEYDSLGRLQKVKNLFNNAYTRYEYPPSQNRVDTYATIQDSAGEAHSFKITDGHGRVIASAADHPGSTGGYSGQLISYDTMGRAIKQSNPTETSASSTNPYDWAATGDDATSNGGTGWLNTQQTYDWKGRPLVTTNTDNTYKSASYGGCGCAGSQVITLTDEVNRQQKIYSDVLGRQLKTEILNTDLTVYSTTKNTFNARDQVTLVRQYQGPDTSTVYQDSTMSYDGYGRLLTRHAPEQQVDPTNSLSTNHTTWTYNDDDTIHALTDARGVTSTFGYNSRRLLSSISYPASQDLPSNVPATADSSFAYDAIGNRISMTDGLGGMSYQYNSLSQLTSETRTFSGSGAPSGNYTLSYQYNLGGELKKITDPTNMTINYGYDNTGRLNGVTGSDTLVGGVSNYASGFQYRAWGGLKQISAGNSHTASLGYNARLQVNHFDISGGVVNQNYDYFNDGRLSFVHNISDNNFDRAYTYDHAGRLTAAATGGEARHDLGAVPMYETFAYNAWGNTTTRVSESWLNDFYDSGTYTNGRRTGWGYDADGRIRSIDTRSYTNDAAGQNTFLSGQRWTPDGYVPTSTTSDFDGDGKRIRETSDSLGYVTTTYYLRSSVLGGAIVEELNSSGQKQLGYVYTPAGGFLARQVPGNDYVSLKQVSPIGASQYEFSFSTTMSESVSRREFDPVGANVPLNNHTSLGHGGAAGDIPGGGGASDSRFSALQNPGAGCVVDGVYTPCDWIGRMLSSGSLALAITSGGKTTRLDLQDFGLGVYGVWVDSEGHRPPSEPKKEVDVDEGDVLRINGYALSGHWELLNIGLAPQKPKYVPVPDIPSSLDVLLRRGDCGDFVQKLIDRLGTTANPFIADYAPDLLKTVNIVIADQGFTKNGKHIAGKAYPRDAKGIGKLGLSPIDGTGDTPYGLRLDTYDYIESVLHELIHFAGKNDRYNDRTVVLALDAMGAIPSGGLRDRFNRLTKDDIDGNSELFDTILRQHCPGPDE